MLYCLTCTLVIECAAAAVIGIRKIKDFLFVILVNVMTNPVLVSLTFFIRLAYGRTAYYCSLAALEIAAVLIEGAVYKFTLKNRINPFLISLILNTSSFFIGELINKTKIPGVFL